MKKVSLLLLSAAACLSAMADDYYVIKDGALQHGITFAAPEDPEASSSLTENENGAVAIRAKGQYQDLKLDLSAADAPLTNLKSRYMVIEYMVPASAVWSEDNDKETSAGADKPLFIFATSEGTLEDIGWSFDAADQSKIYMDPKFSDNKVIDQYYGPAGQFETKMLYPYAKNNEAVQSIFIAYMRENSFDEYSDPCYIKNLYYAEPAAVPFFAECFTGPDTWTESPNMGKLATKAENMACGYAISYEDPDAEKGKTCKYFLCYENSLQADGRIGSDGSRFLASETYHALMVNKGQVTMQFADVEIPAAVQQGGKMEASCIAKLYPKDEYVLTGDLAVEQLPIKLVFNDAANTEVLLFQDSLINGMWTAEIAKDITVPAGATKVTIKIPAMANFSYLVDNLILAAPGFVSVATVESDKNELTIAPNPVKDAIMIGADVESVIITNMAGASQQVVVANGVVNVSNLASGIYTINVNGVTGKFIKK